MHVDAAIAGLSLLDHHARKLVAIFRSLRESRPNSGQAAKADRHETRLDHGSDATTFCNGRAQAASAALTTVSGNFGHRCLSHFASARAARLVAGISPLAQPISRGLKRDDF
jgi:hypothetical protein